jgi:hypothetical protein
MTTINFAQTDKNWEFGFLQFHDLGEIDRGVTHRYKVSSVAGDGLCLLGWVEWKAGWRKYTFRPILGVSTWYDFSCLTTIAEFCKIRTDERKAQWGPQGRFPDRVE